MSDLNLRWDSNSNCFDIDLESKNTKKAEIETKIIVALFSNDGWLTGDIKSNLSQSLLRTKNSKAYLNAIKIDIQKCLNRLVKENIIQKYDVTFEFIRDKILIFIDYHSEQMKGTISHAI